MKMRRLLGWLLVPAFGLLAYAGVALTDIPPVAAIIPPMTVPPGQPTPATPLATGTLVWRDYVGPSDTIMLSISGLPAPAAGHIYTAWLASTTHRLHVGTLQLSGGGAARLSYTSPTHDNLLGQYDRVYVTQEPVRPAATEEPHIVLVGALPAQALRSIRQILVASDGTPGKRGYALGLRQEMDKVVYHAQALRAAFTAGDFAAAKRQAEQLVNIIEGAHGTHFGDLNGDGERQNPGDGFGLLQNDLQLGYIEGLREQAQHALDAADATDEVKLHVGHVRVAGENVRVRLTGIRNHALHVVQASNMAATQPDLRTILALAEQAMQGMDMNLDELVGPIAGE
ncbi:MAG: hypothetical protein M3380_17435, partial [Chloroflexota bacterium]|nr:hypothetical protein [Chloroflexota bacterium]